MRSTATNQPRGWEVSRALGRLRERLHTAGMKLLLDFVPNHTGFDHPWTREHPEFYVQLDHQRAARMHPEERSAFPAASRQGKLWIAHGKDPYFPAWTDTAQLDYGRADVRAAQIEELRTVARHCDGVRCDMAMLLLDEVRRKTWGESSCEDEAIALGSREFWEDATRVVRSEFRDFVMIAEVYWELEHRLVSQGFDYAYDKRLYDAIVAGNMADVQELVQRDRTLQKRLVRFLENHDEPRAARAIPLERRLQAVALTYTLPGARLFHEGQFEGRQIKIPVQLLRVREEDSDPAVAELYEKLLEVLRTDLVGNGVFRQRSARAGDEGLENVYLHTWSDGASEHIAVAVNLSEDTVAVDVPLCSARGSRTARDQFTGELFPARDGVGEPHHKVPLAAPPGAHPDG